MTGTRPRGRKFGSAEDAGDGGDAEDGERAVWQAARVAALAMRLVRYSCVRVRDWRRLATFTPSPMTE